MATPNIVPRAAGEGGLGTAAKGWGGLFATNTTTSSATEGGKLVLAANDGGAMEDDHRLGVIEFSGAEDDSSTLTIGARIQAICDAGWSATENGASLEFYTTDANASESLVLSIDSNKLATFPGAVTVTGALTATLTGQASTVATIAGLAPNTATTAAAQTNITSLGTLTALNVSGLITATHGSGMLIKDATTSSATEGGTLVLASDDGAAMADNHRLGVIEFKGAEDASNNLTIGARIQAICDAGWSASENGASLEFYTTDGNASESVALTLDSDNKAIFAGVIETTTRTLKVTSDTDGDANGDVAYFGGTTSMTTGAIYHYKNDGTWELADADAVATSDGLLGVALGAASDTNGVLLRGFVTIDHDPGAIGDVLYLSTTAGDCSATAPSGSADIVRVVGYQVSHASNGNIWFNPDNTYIELA